MLFALLSILLGLTATSMALPSGVEPAVDLLPKLIPKAGKRQVSIIDGLQSREIGGGFIAVLPQGNSIPANGDDGTKRRRRYLRKDEIIVPESLHEPFLKRAPSCSTGWDLCSGQQFCCPRGGDCCSGGSCCSSGHRCCGGRLGGCCPDTHNCVTVSGTEGCCPIGKTCVAGNECAAAGYVACSNDNFCCKPGYTCSRDSLGNRVCRPPDDHTTTTKPLTTMTATATSSAWEPSIPPLIPMIGTIAVALPTYTFSLPTASNITSSASSTSWTTDPTAAVNGAIAVTYREIYFLLVAPVLLASGHVLAIP